MAYWLEYIVNTYAVVETIALYFGNPPKCM